MSLSEQQKQVIMTIDSRAKTILARGGNNDTLLAEMLEFMPDIRNMLYSVPKKEIEMTFCEYDGFYYYMKMLENLAQAITDGCVTVSN